MFFAVNYSPEAEQLVQLGYARIDRFKCPAWPDLVATVQERHPVYVHFPLQVGSGIGDATTGGEPAAWTEVERLLAQTATPLVNLHYTLNDTRTSADPAETGQRDPGSTRSYAEELVENLARDISSVTARFGKDRVALENDHDFGGVRPRAAIQPSVLRRAVETTGCGLVLDLAHARLAARSLGVEARDYVKALPTHRLREIHVSGVQQLDGQWLARVSQAVGEDDPVEHPFGRLADHMPMTGPDWELFGWAMAHIHSGAWPRPWVVTFEYGGSGPLFSALTDVDVLASQMPRVNALARGKQSGDQGQDIYTGDIGPGCPRRRAKSVSGYLSRGFEPTTGRRARDPRLRRGWAQYDLHHVLRHRAGTSTVSTQLQTPSSRGPGTVWAPAPRGRRWVRIRRAPHSYMVQGAHTP